MRQRESHGETAKFPAFTVAFRAGVRIFRRVANASECVRECVARAAGSQALLHRMDQSPRRCRVGRDALSGLSRPPGVTEAWRADPQLRPRVVPPLAGVDRFVLVFFDLLAARSRIRSSGTALPRKLFTTPSRTPNDPATLGTYVGCLRGMANSLYTEASRFSRNRDMKSAVGQMAIDATTCSVDYATVSYRLGLHGEASTMNGVLDGSRGDPSRTQSLRAGESDFLSGGHGRGRASPRRGYHWARAGSSRRMGAAARSAREATGTIFGGGVGVVLLRHKPDALQAPGDAMSV